MDTIACVVDTLDIGISFVYNSDQVLSWQEGLDIAGSLLPVYENVHYSTLDLPQNPYITSQPLIVWIRSRLGGYLNVQMMGRSGGAIDAELSQLEDRLTDGDEDQWFEHERIPLRRWKEEPIVVTDEVTDEE